MCQISVKTRWKMLSFSHCRINRPYSQVSSTPIRHIFRLGIITFQRCIKILTTKEIFHSWLSYHLIATTKAYQYGLCYYPSLTQFKRDQKLFETIPQTPCDHHALTKHKRVQNLFQAISQIPCSIKSTQTSTYEKPSLLPFFLFFFLSKTLPLKWIVELWNENFSSAFNLSSTWFKSQPNLHWLKPTWQLK